MNSKRPYLLRAFCEWICDNGCTPHVVVDGTAAGVSLPPPLAGTEQVVLNIGPRAIRNLSIDGDALAFDARFSGTPHHVHVPISAVLAVYARENGEGMAFEPESSGTPPEPPPASPGDKPGAARAKLSVVK